MAFFGLFSKPTPRSVAELLSEKALSLDTTSAEKACAAALGVELHIYVKERLLMRIGFTESVIQHYFRQDPCREIELCGEMVAQAFLEYMLSRPGVPKDAGGDLYARATRDYFLQKPNELAAKMITSMYNGEHRPMDPLLQIQFMELVHELARDTMERVRDNTAKLRPKVN